VSATSHCAADGSGYHSMIQCSSSSASVSVYSDGNCTVMASLASSANPVTRSLGDCYLANDNYHKVVSCDQFSSGNDAKAIYTFTDSQCVYPSSAISLTSTSINGKSTAASGCFKYSLSNSTVYAFDFLCSSSSSSANLTVYPSDNFPNECTSHGSVSLQASYSQGSCISLTLPNLSGQPTNYSAKVDCGNGIGPVNSAALPDTLLCPLIFLPELLLFILFTVLS